MNTMMTRTNIFEHMKQFLDKYSKTTNYMLQELKSNGIIYNSYFDSKEKAQIYAKSICDESSTIYIYKSYCMKIYDPVDNMDDESLDNMNDEPVDNMDDENYDPKMDFTNMTLWSYGKGWLLEPNEDSDYYGKKYFHEGWWVESQNGWFFKDEHYQWLIDHGAVLSTDDTMDSDVESTDVDLSNMTLWSYGKGWLLEPLQDNEYFGEKYFHEGWWMSKQNGWFFKNEHYQWLIDRGVVLSNDDDTMEQDIESTDAVLSNDDTMEENLENTEVDLSNMTLWSYGKGWLLEPLQDNEYFGEKYFHEGWWMPKQDGWFFKNEHYQWLIDHGVILSTDDDIMESGVESKEVNLSNITLGSYNMELSKMSLEEYGKGYILKTTKKDNLYGEKYFMDGFWNKTQKGWFFKSEYFDELINMGAKYIKTEKEKEQENILSNSTELSSSITNDSFEYVYDDNEFMTNEDRVVPKFNKYGKGWILKADNNYKYSKGLEYFEGGWWIPSIKGWFFKSSQKKEFMKKHFDI